MKKLLSPYCLAGLALRNRIVMAPMVVFGLCREDGFATPAHAAHYAARAQGAGLVIVEATCVSRDGRLAGDQMGLWEDAQTAGHSAIATACHEGGAAVLVQLHHAGARAIPGDGTSGQSVGDLSLGALAALQEQFVCAALRAYRAGYDGVELHGAHGYLISQFLSPRTNQRDDAYGGGPENRSRFAAEVAREIRRVTAPDFVIGCRMGVNSPDLDASAAIGRYLCAAGVQVIHCSFGNAMDDGPVPAGFPFNRVVYGGVMLGRQLPCPVIAVNGIRTHEQAELLLQSFGVPLVAVGRALLADPLWAHKAASGGEVAQCLACRRCTWFVGKSERCPAARPDLCRDDASF